MRFRNPEFTITSEYQKRIVEYKGEQVVLSIKTFTSKVDIDGITFTFGIAFYF
jgi:hypothetical protein